ncbi:MAG: restriction endonuclease subunit S [Alphaproteobacteria bacterium]|nr:restriction endonuclease subunit S [Alphaproteobacteria bacterium]
MKAVPLREVVSIDRDQRQWARRPYVGMEDIESGTGRLLGNVDIATVKSTTFGFTNRHVLYGRLRPYLNKVLLPDFNGHCSTEIMPLLPTSGIDRSYLWYWLSSASTVAAIDATCTGARMPRANMDAVLELEIPLPLLEEQRRIVAVLDEAFAAIAQATANAEKNLANATLTYEASLDSYVTTALNSFGSTMLSKICAHITDGDHSPPPKADTGVPFVTISNLNKRSGNINFEDTFFVPETYYKALRPSRIPELGDLLYTVTGATLGVPSLVEQNKAFCFQRHIAIIKPEKHVSSAWLLHILRSPNVFRQASLGATGAAQKTVSLALLRALSIPKSDRLDQLAAAARLTAIFQAADDLVRVYSAKLARLRELKQSLLHRAFTGELATTPELAPA